MKFAVDCGLRADQMIVTVQLDGAIGQVAQPLDHPDLAMGNGPDPVVHARGVLRAVDQDYLSAADGRLHAVPIADRPE